MHFFQEDAFDNVDDIQNRYQFNKFVHNVFDNFELDNQELHELNS